MARLLVLACLALVLAACGVGDTASSERLGKVGEDLIPAGAEHVETQEGSCPQIAGNPSCARVYFVSDLPVEERADGLEEAAEAQGWEVVAREPRTDGVFVELGKKGFRLFAALYEDERAGPCAEQPDPDCADELQVIEDI